MSKFQGMHISDKDMKRREWIRKKCPYYRNVDIYIRGIDTIEKELKKGK